jgi:hypothetical protein
MLQNTCISYRLSKWYSPSAFVKEFGGEKSRAVYESGPIRTYEWGSVTPWKKARLK